MGGGKVVIRVRKEGNEGLERVCQEFTEALLQVKGSSFTGLRHEQRVGGKKPPRERVRNWH